MINRTIGATELKRNTGAILDDVRFGNANIVVTKGNKPYVIIIPYDKNSLLDKRKKAFRKYSKKIPNLSLIVAKARKELNHSLEFGNI